MAYAENGAQKFFVALLAWRSRRPTGIPGPWHAEAQNYLWGNLTPVSDFMQSIVVRAFPFGRLTDSPLDDRPAGSISSIA
jgi:hypothetical protein